MQARIGVHFFICLLLIAAGSGCGSKKDSKTVQGEPPPPAEGFSVVLLPDAQCYPSGGAPYSPGSCGSSPNGNLEMMKAQTDWIAARREDFRIAAVVGVGDTVNDGARDNEWLAASEAYKTLDDAGLPYIVAIGNHDYDTAGASLGGRLTEKYNRYFGVSRFNQYSWYGNSNYPPGRNDNSYLTFDAGDSRYMVVSLEFFPRAAALQWAADLIAANPDRQVIVVTHAYLGPDGSRLPSRWNGPPSSSGITDGSDGETMWNTLIRQFPNIIAAVNGHASPSNGSIGAASRVDRGVEGNSVAQMFSNYQYMAGGGSGYLRLLNIQLGHHQIVVHTYSPYLNMWMIDSANSFSSPIGFEAQDIQDMYILK